MQEGHWNRKEKAVEHGIIYVDTLDKTLRTFLASTVSEPVKFDSIQMCGLIPIVHFPNGLRSAYYQYSPDYYLRMLVDSCWCGDSISVMQNPSQDGAQVVIFGAKFLYSMYPRTFYPMTVAPMIIMGEEGFCAPSHFAHRNSYGMLDLHNWGILGRKGQWLVEPKFDSPFRFQNGFADVMYYGQKRKINEKGEFVESLDREGQ